MLQFFYNTKKEDGILNASKTDFKEIAALSRISIDESLLPAFEKDMSDIVAFASIVNSAPEAEKAFPASVKNVLKEDTVVPSPERDELLSVAPSEEDGFFCVMRVID